MQNVDSKTVDGFGDEWSRFDYSEGGEELERSFAEYFAVFPWDELPKDAVGFDAGCGTGRWARYVAPRIGRLHCVDASDRALDVARGNLSSQPNVEFHHASIADMPLSEQTAYLQWIGRQVTKPGILQYLGQFPQSDTVAEILSMA